MLYHKIKPHKVKTQIKDFESTEGDNKMMVMAVALSNFLSNKY